MNFWIFFGSLAFFILFILFIPDLFPWCSCCHRKKFRLFFRIHKAISINPGYSGSRSVCRKCCRQYDLEDLKDLDRLISIQRKIKLETLLK